MLQGPTLRPLRCTIGKSVCLFLYFVNESVHRLLGRNTDLPLSVGEGAGLMKIVLDHTEQRNIKSHFLHHGAHGVHLSASAVKQDQIGCRTEGGRAVADMGKTARERLTH